jgi:hypothetical protein
MVRDKLLVLVDKDNKVVAFVDKLASSIEDSIALLFRVRFASTRLIRKEEWRQSIRMQLQPMQQCMTNRTKFSCCHAKSKLKEKDMVN